MTILRNVQKERARAELRIVSISRQEAPSGTASKSLLGEHRSLYGVKKRAERNVQTSKVSGMVFGCGNQIENSKLRPKSALWQQSPCTGSSGGLTFEKATKSPHFEG